ncbi:hypothetical protein D9M72_186610 [compost metagenome]
MNIGCLLPQELDLNMYKKSLIKILGLFLYICEHFTDFFDLFAVVYLLDPSDFVGDVDLVYSVDVVDELAFVADPVCFDDIADLAVFFRALDQSLVADVDHFLD